LRLFTSVATFTIPSSSFQEMPTDNKQGKGY
jgi:hypothetical protein